jgi:hypothetical protein
MPPALLVLELLFELRLLRLREQPQARVLHQRAVRVERPDLRSVRACACMVASASHRAAAAGSEGTPQP